MTRHPLDRSAAFTALAAHRADAAAALAGYRQDAGKTDTAGRAMWGARLADALTCLLGSLDALDTAQGGLISRAHQAGEV